MKFETDKPVVVKLYDDYLMLKRLISYIESFDIMRLKHYLIRNNIIDYIRECRYKLKDGTNNYPKWKIYKANKYIIKKYFDKEMAKIGRKLENKNLITFRKNYLFHYYFKDKLKLRHKMLKRLIIREQYGNNIPNEFKKAFDKILIDY